MSSLKHVKVAPKGKRFVRRPIPASEYAEILEQVRRWGLDQHLKETRVDSLIHAPAG